MAKTHTDNETSTDAENPYLPPAKPNARFRGSDEHSRGWSTIIAANVALIPIYLLVLVASVIELAGVKDIASRGAVDYWRHAIASLTFLGICGATLHLARRRSRLAKYSFIASLLFVVIMINPGLNMVWNAVARLIDHTRSALTVVS